ncbi:MAG: hypothetical protein EOP83_14020 [Verrucomicrobiaceae bacterium]|nr:MAG: hypothetical protein EOP83_14020 [Verrucomicrobiaceae bacterium]
MTKAKSRQFTAHLPQALAQRIDLCARYSGKAADTIVSDLVAACMEDLPAVIEEGAEGVEKLLQLLQQGNVSGYQRASEFLQDVIEEVTMPAVVEARKAQGLERLPSQRSENEKRPVTSKTASAIGGSESSHA